jgi:hypothetical protein
MKKEKNRQRTPEVRPAKSKRGYVVEVCRKIMTVRTARCRIRYAVDDNNK